VRAATAPKWVRRVVAISQRITASEAPLVCSASPSTLGPSSPSWIGPAALLVLALLSAAFVFDHALWTPDEPRDAEIARETGLGLIPMLDQEPFLEKPPLYYWTVAASYSAFGVSAWASRIPSILFGCGTLVFTYLLARRAFGPAAGVYAALVLSTTALFVQVTHKCAVDDALLFFTTGTLYWLREGSRSERKLSCYALAYLLALGAFLSKGPIGLALVGPAFLAFLLWTGNAREILRARPWLGVLIVGAGAALWVAALPPELRHIFLVDNQLGRVSGTNSLAGHVRPFYYYVVAAPPVFLPWTLVLVPALAWSFAPGETTEKRFLLSWLLTGLLILSLAATKRELYLLPLVPAGAILIAGWFVRVAEPPVWGRILIRITAGLLILAHAALWALAIALPTFAGLAISVAIAGGVWLFVRQRSAVERLCFGAASLLLGAILVLVPTLDRAKNLQPFCDMLPRVDRIAALEPDETTRAVLPFYCGVWVDRFGGTEDFVLVTGKAHEPEAPPGYKEVTRFAPGQLRLFGITLRLSDRMLLLAARDR